MKKLLALLLALSLLLCGCGAEPEPTTGATTEPTTAPTTEPTTAPTTEPAPVYTNPLTGRVIDEPFTGRVYAVTISNVVDALPHVGMAEADIYMEMFVNGSIIRGLALYTDPASVVSIGSVRSTRLMFNDIAQHYDLILSHAGGSNQVMNDAANRGIDHMSVDTWDSYEFGASFRDDYRKRNIGYEHSLLAKGDMLESYAESKGYELTRAEDKDYGLTFTEDGTPAGGETAASVKITFKYRGTVKETIMQYDEELGMYVYNQYGKTMYDGFTQAPEAFENVVVMHANISTNGIYYQADFVAGGTGYYACGGQIIPITWTCDGEDQPFRFFTQEGEPLSFGVGNTYIGIAPIDSPLSYE
ncbi:MAG: DUF3048 domain-containing protein [Oscillospiraceae bacterium]|nr:DUF3048 domain-containing protein [Oscillospiraceae bacterium]